jgi:biotin operon repressor
MRKSISDHCWPVISGPQDWDAVMLDPASTEAGSSRRIEVLMEPQVHRQFVLEQAKRFQAAGWTVLYCVFSYDRAVKVVQGLIDDAKAAGTEPVVFQEDPLLLEQSVATLKDYGADFEFPGSAEEYDDAGFVMVTGNRLLQSKVEKALAQLSRYSEEPVKLLVIDEFSSKAGSLVFDGVDKQQGLARLSIPAPVLTVEPQPCPYCGRLLRVTADKKGLKYFCERRSKHRANGHPDRYEVSATVPLLKAGGSYRPLSTRRAWTEEDSAKAVELRRQGLTHKAIGEQLGRSRAAVEEHLRSGGIQGTRVRQQMRKAVEQIIAEQDRQRAAQRAAMAAAATNHISIPV